MRKYLLLLSFILVIMNGCDNLTDPNLNNGLLKIYLVDAPSSLDSVIIFVKQVDVHKSDGGDNSGWYVINDSLRPFNLLELTNGASAVLGDSVLVPGKYTQIRLILGEGNYVIDQGVKYYLTVPSGMQTGIKLNHQFTIESDNLYELLLDFNVDKSVHITGAGNYMLKPVIRAMSMIISGSISGQVLPPDAQAAVFTTIGPDTVTTYPDINGFFKLMALPEGIYNVEINSGNVLYKDTVVTGINVLAMQNTNIGVVELKAN